MNSSKYFYNLIFVILVWFLLVFVGVNVFTSYMGGHKYYEAMLSNWQNIIIVLSCFFSALIPVSYLALVKEKKIQSFILSLLVGHILFGSLFVGIKGALVGGLSAVISYSLNTIVLYFFYFSLLGGLLALGTLVRKYLFKTEVDNILDLIIAFGIGLVLFLFTNTILIVFKLFYPFVTWSIFLGGLALIYLRRFDLKEYLNIIFSVFDNINLDIKKLKNNNIFKYTVILLIAMTIMYFYFGSLLSYIPYPTAWDANHAYFFYPRIRAINNGFFWGSNGIMESPYLWYGYISFFFSLLLPFENHLWVSPDTIAVTMNFLSGIFVLLFGLALIKEFILLVGAFLKKNGITIDSNSYDYSNKAFFIGWLLLLAWLTSGMGAFLVFVDNKTDLGILSLIILALYSGFHFIRMSDYIEDESGSDKKQIFGLNYKVFYSIVFSSIFFASASLAKPTALLDVMSFGLVLVGLRFGSIGTIGGGMSVLGFLAIINFRDTGVYISQEFGLILLAIGFTLFLYSILYKFKSKIQNLKKFLLWSLVFLLIIFVYKSPLVILTKNLTNSELNIKTYLESVLLGVNTNKKINVDDDKKAPTLLLSSTEDIPSIIGTGEKSSLSNDGPLYENLKKAGGDNYKEDVGRYIGYGRRSFNNPYWGVFFSPFAGKCLGLNSVAVKLCNNQTYIDSLNIDKLNELLSTIDKDSKGYKYLSDYIDVFTKEDISSQDSIKNAVGNNYSVVTSLKDFINDNSIRIQKVCFVAVGSSKVDKLKNSCLVKEDSSIIGKEVVNQLMIDIPYNYLKVFNITFNWSLQNESSYYTDIGYIWLIVYFFVIVGFIYGIGNSHKLLITLNGVSVLGWIVWTLIGGGILWYGIGLIIWSILSFITFIIVLIINVSNNNKLRLYFEIAIYFFVILLFLQVLINFVRISTQGGEGPFLQYKTGVGKKTVVTQDLSQKQEVKVGYSSKDIFALQFPHYNKFIKLSDSRNQGEQVFLAGTYARYFLTNQEGIIADQMLNWLWEMFSDFDVNKSYARLVDKNIKYIVIDPNIGTVVMGGGNISLFDRFFAKINQLNGTFEQDGVITMLSRLISNNRISLISTNNLSIKYAYSLSDDQIASFIGTGATDQDIVLLRSKLATSRFWPNKNDLHNFCVTIAKQRIVSLDFIDDFADVLGKQIDSNKLKKIVVGINQLKSVRDGITKYSNEIRDLSEDEKMVFLQFMNLYVTLINDPTSLDDMLFQFIQSSTVSSSQIILFQVN
ncbi:MAG: hypothetical protein V3575_05370 [Candidatus Absconditabacteria bacterium]